MWLSRPITPTAQKKALTYDDLFTCTIARSQPGLVFLQISHVPFYRCSQAHHEEDDLARDGGKTKLKRIERGILGKKHKERIANMLLGCQEYRSDGSICVPWSQVDTYILHRHFTSGFILTVMCVFGA